MPGLRHGGMITHLHPIEDPELGLASVQKRYVMKLYSSADHFGQWWPGLPEAATDACEQLQLWLANVLHLGPLVCWHALQHNSSSVYHAAHLFTE